MSFVEERPYSLAHPEIHFTYSNKTALQDLTRFVNKQLTNFDSGPEQLPSELVMYLLSRSRLLTFIESLSPKDVLYIANSALSFYQKQIISPILHLVDKDSQIRLYVMRTEEEMTNFYSLLAKRIQLRLNKFKVDFNFEPDLALHGHHSVSNQTQSDQNLFRILRGTNPMPTTSNCLDLNMTLPINDQELGYPLENSHNLSKRSLDLLRLKPISTKWLKKHFTSAIEGMT